MKQHKKAQLSQDTLTAMQGSKFYQMFEKVPYKKVQKGNFFVTKSSKQ